MSEAKMHGMHHALARLYTLAEVQEALRTPAQGALDTLFRYGLQGAIGWSQLLDAKCAFCNDELAGHATYLIVLMSTGPEPGLGCSGACCVNCGQRLPRERLQELAEQAARVMFEPAMARA